MEVEPPLGNRPVLGRHRCSGGGGWTGLRRPVERIGDQRRDGAEVQRRQVQHARREDLRLPPGEEGHAHGRTRVGLDETWDHWAYHLQVLEAAPALMELKSWLLGAGGLRGGRNQVLGWRRCGGGGALGGRLHGACEHLDYLLEGRGVSLDEGGGERIGVDGFR